MELQAVTNEENRMDIAPTNGNTGTVPPWLVSQPLPSVPLPPLPGPDEPDAED